MKKTFLLLFTALLFSQWSFAQTKLIEKIEKKGDEIVIPYEKYELENGLTLIIHEDHSDPLVHVDVTYHVGSAREEVGKSGFAHFFEHMLFQGSENVADEEHFKIVTESGGTLNGTTNRDRTNYFETVPSNQLETMLWLESDRMGFFLDAVTQEKFEVQRATVKNERGQGVDNAPYGLVREKIFRALYPYGHPYSWTTIGDIEDLNRVNVDDLKKFFMRWYGPNNATLTIGGDVNPQEVVKLVEKYFGVIERRFEVLPDKREKVTLDKDRYISYEDRNIRFPALAMTFPTVPRYHPDEPALDCLADILGQGRDSYFYKKFVLTQKAIQAGMSSIMSELAGEMQLFVLPFPGTSLADFETMLREALVEFEKDGVKEEDVEKFKTQYETRRINGLSSVFGKVAQLASYQTFTGNPNYIQKELNAYQNITAEDVIRVYNTYIKGQYAVILSVIPEGSEGIQAKPDNYTPKRFDPSATAPKTEELEGLTYKRPVGDKFDRSKKPTPGKNPLVSVPEFWTSEFDNGLKMIGVRSDEIPTVTMTLSLEGGHQLNAYDPSKVGLARLTASIMNESTENYSSAEISNKLESLGSSISVSSGNTNTSITVRSLTKNLTATLDLLEEKLMRPAFNEEDFARVKKQQIEGIKSQAKNPRSIASLAYNELIYGKDHIMSLPASGTVETIENITIEDVKTFYDKYYSPSVGELVVVGDVDQREVVSGLEFLEEWESKKVKMPSMPTSPEIDKTKLYLIDKKGAPQSEIRIGYLTDMTYDATGEYYKSYLMNYVLGGAFNSRINLNLREDKGYTYGAGSSFGSNRQPGPYSAGAGVRADASADAIRQFMKEISNYEKNGITEEELEFMKKSIGQRDARSYETPLQKAEYLRRILTYDLDKDFVKQQSKIIENITADEINALAKKHLPSDKMHILIVGDKAVIYDDLKELGYEIIELTKDEVSDDVIRMNPRN